MASKPVKKNKKIKINLSLGQRDLKGPFERHLYLEEDFLSSFPRDAWRIFFHFSLSKEWLAREISSRENSRDYFRQMPKLFNFVLGSKFFRQEHFLPLNIDLFLLFKKKILVYEEKGYWPSLDSPEEWHNFLGCAYNPRAEVIPIRLKIIFTRITSVKLSLFLLDIQWIFRDLIQPSLEEIFRFKDFLNRNQFPLGTKQSIGVIFSHRYFPGRKINRVYQGPDKLSRLRDFSTFDFYNFLSRFISLELARYRESDFELFSVVFPVIGSITEDSFLFKIKDKTKKAYIDLYSRGRLEKSLEENFQENPYPRENKEIFFIYMEEEEDFPS